MVVNDEMVWGNRKVASIGIRVLRDCKPTGDIDGAIANASKVGRAAHQWVKPKMARKRHQVSRSALSTSFPLNSKVQAR